MPSKADINIGEIPSADHDLSSLVSLARGRLVEAGESTLEKRKQIVKKYEAIIRSLVMTDICEIENGERNGVRWRKTFGSGKQQPVIILEFTFPEEVTFELVFRPTHNDFEGLVNMYPVVERYFPHLYLAEKVYCDGSTTRNVLVLDRIKGYEEKHDPAEFTRHISEGNNFDRLCEEIFQMVHEIYQEPLILEDVKPASGHNVFYNTDTGHFQLFDVDTIKTSDLPQEVKWMKFLGQDNLHLDQRQMEFTLKMIQLHRNRFPDATLSYEGDEYTSHRCVLVNEKREDSSGLIYPNNPNYEAYYSAINWRGTGGRTDLPPIELIARRMKDRVSIRGDLIDAIDTGDWERAEAIYKAHRGLIMVKESFVVQ